MDEVVNDVPVTEEPVVEETTQPGEKTDSALLLKSLQEERDARKKLELELQRLSEQPVVDVFSDEGKLLKGQIEALEHRLAEKDTLSSLQSKYPALRDKSSEFDEFRANPENAGMKLETAAKAFLVEKDLLTSPQPRKGLEKESGGGRVPPKTGRTEEEIAELRTTNFRKYLAEVKAGTLRQ